MGLSKTEVNLSRLLSAAPQQQNQGKLIHYVAILREQLEQLAEEKTPEGLPRVSKAQLNDYSEKIEAIAAKLDVAESSTQVNQEPSFEAKAQESPSAAEEEVLSPRGLRRRYLPPSVDRSPSSVEDINKASSVKLDAAAHAHIEKHRKLQEDLTDEMVGLARQLKESSLAMSQSILNTEKILDSTEKAVEQSLASQWACKQSGNGGILAEPENIVLHMAVDLCHDLHIHHGCTSNSCYLGIIPLAHLQNLC